MVYHEPSASTTIFLSSIPATSCGISLKISNALESSLPLYSVVSGRYRVLVYQKVHIHNVSSNTIFDTLRHIPYTIQACDNVPRGHFNT